MNLDIIMYLFSSSFIVLALWTTYYFFTDRKKFSFGAWAFAMGGVFLVVIAYDTSNEYKKFTAANPDSNLTAREFLNSRKHTKTESRKISPEQPKFHSLCDKDSLVKNEIFMIEKLNESIKPENELVFNQEGNLTVVQEYNIGVLQGLSSASPENSKVVLDLMMLEYKESDLALFKNGFLSRVETIESSNRYNKLIHLLLDEKGKPIQDSSSEIYSIIISELWENNLSDTELENRLLYLKSNIGMR
jgi:hypothetical protein